VQGGISTAGKQKSMASRKRIRTWRWFLLLALVVAGVVPVRADVALLLEEPYGRFGFINPTGHIAVYLPRVCADSPVHLRRCGPGESGVVISRYRRVAGYDWLAVPLIPYLYAVETPEEVPAFVTTGSVALLRDAYRRNHLRDLIPDGPDGKMPAGDWVQLVGESYDRKIYGFEIETSEAQDAQLIQEFNRRPNHAHFNLFIHNCADLARNLIDLYFPKAVHRSVLADAGITTPKQVAKSLVTYSRRHPQLQFSSFVIPQVPGQLHRSYGVHGVAESVVKSKEYVVPLLLLHPYITASLAVAYAWRGRFNPGHEVTILNSPFELQRQMAFARPRPHGTQPTPSQKTASAAPDADPLSKAALENVKLASAKGQRE